MAWNNILFSKNYPKWQTTQTCYFHIAYILIQLFVPLKLMLHIAFPYKFGKWNVIWVESRSNMLAIYIILLISNELLLYIYLLLFWIFTSTLKWFALGFSMFLFFCLFVFPSAAKDFTLHIKDPFQTLWQFFFSI